MILNRSTSLIFAASTLGFALLSFAQAAGQQAAPSTIPYATLQQITGEDTDATIAERAAKVLPRPNQSAWMHLERTFFIHFGPNTFRGVEWGTGK